MLSRSIFRRGVLLSVAAFFLAAPQIASAQETSFEPITLAFDGTSAMRFAPSSAIDIRGAGTVEMWVKAKWPANPGYDPAILSYQGPKGPRLAVLITADAKALGVYAGAFYDAVPFDFSDGELHHVALIIIGDTTMVMIDGEVRDTLGFGMANLPASTLSIGSLGGFSPFVGEIGQIRIWNEPLDPQTLVDFAWRRLASDGPEAHPNLNALVGASTFGNPETGGFLFFGPNEDANVTAATDDPIDDSDLRLDDPALADPAPAQYAPVSPAPSAIKPAIPYEDTPS